MSLIFAVCFLNSHNFWSVCKVKHLQLFHKLVYNVWMHYMQELRQAKVKICGIMLIAFIKTYFIIRAPAVWPLPYQLVVKNMWQTSEFLPFSLWQELSPDHDIQCHLGGQGVGRWPFAGQGTLVPCLLNPVAFEAWILGVRLPCFMAETATELWMVTLNTFYIVCKPFILFLSARCDYNILFRLYSYLCWHTFHLCGVVKIRYLWPPPPPPLLPSLYGRRTLLTGKAPTLSSFGFRGIPNWQLVEIVHPVNVTIIYGVISESSQTLSVLKCTYICSWLFLPLE